MSNVVLTAQVKDTAKARQELESLGRASSQAASETSKGNQEIATSSRAAAEQAMRQKTANAELRVELARTAAASVRLAGEFVSLGQVAMIVSHNSGSVLTGVKLLTHFMGPLGVAIAGTIVALKAYGDAMEYIQEKALPAAAASETAMTSLRIVTERTGNSFAEAQQILAQFDDALTSRTSVAQAVRVFNSMGVSMERQIQLISAMRDGIVAMGGDVNTQLPIMALAIKRQEGELLDNMGVVSTVERMYKNYAATVGTTADKLTQAQREEAVMQGVLSETAKFSGSAAASMDTYQGAVNALATEQRKLAEEVGATFAPLAKLVTEIERGATALARWSWVNVLDMKAKTPAERFEEIANALGITLPTQTNAKIQAAEEEQRRKTLKRLQERGRELLAIRQASEREGGYGPANLADSAAQKHREEQAKKAESEAREAQRKREADATRARQKAKQEAERIANEQKTLAQQLARDLATTGKQGWDLLMAQEDIAHKERLQKAHGNKKLLEDAEKLHVAKIAEIRKGLGGKEQFGPWLPGQDPETIKRSAEEAQQSLRQGIASGVQAGISDGVPGLMGALEAGSKDALVKGIGKAIEASAANGVLGALGASLANPLVAAFAVVFAAGIGRVLDEQRREAELWDRYVTRDSERSQESRDLEAVNGRRGALSSQLEFIDQGLARLKSREAYGFGVSPMEIKRLEDERARIQGEISKTDQITAGINREAAEMQRQAARDFSDRLADMRAMMQDRRYGLARSARDLRLDNDLASGRIGRGDYDNAKHANRIEDFKAGELDFIATKMGGGTLGASSADELFNRLVGGNRDSAIRDFGMDMVLLMEQVIANIDAMRAMPGSSPDKPSYTVVLNQKDIWAFAPKDAFFRPSGPGTRRDDTQRGRGINTGKR